MNISAEHNALLHRLSRQAAAWWRERLESANSFDNGDSSEHGGLASGLAQLVASVAPAISPAQLVTLEQALADTVLAWLLEDPCPPERNPHYAESEEERQQILARPRREQCFGTDYGPDGYFYPAIEAAGITDTSAFPWKTLMWVSWDERPECCYIKVKSGYGGARERLPSP